MHAVETERLCHCFLPSFFFLCSVILSDAVCVNEPPASLKRDSRWSVGKLGATLPWRGRVGERSEPGWGEH